jgi:hypothetical protein
MEIAKIEVFKVEGDQKNIIHNYEHKIDDIP